MKNAKYLILSLVGIIALFFLFYLTRLSFRLENQTAVIKPTVTQNSEATSSPENSNNLASADYSAAEVYLRDNIKTLSPEPAVLGGTFYVTKITWQEDGSALVEYEDGHIALRAQVTLGYSDAAKTTIIVRSFKIID